MSRLDSPSGGIKRLYTHVEILRENGYDAYIMHFSKGFKLRWFENKTPVVYFSDSPRIEPNDTVVIPEGFPRVIKQFKPLQIKKVVISLSFAYIFDSMPLGENWKDYGINWVMTTNDVIKDLIQWSMGIENVHIIASSIDNNIFHYNPDMKTQQVAYIKRKDTLSPIVEKILKSRNTDFRELDFITMENLDVRHYAHVLKQSEIYLTTSIHEGLNRSVLEAMACGCICIGFDGVGGKDFIVESGDRQNFVLAESMNFIDLSQKLAELLEKDKRKDPAVDAIRQNALATAASFSPDLEKKSLLEFWKTFFEAES